MGADGYSDGVLAQRARGAAPRRAGAHLRGEVSAGGESFVSGHALLVTALAGLVSPYLRGRWKIVPWVIVAVVMVIVTRVYVGAHNPLDVLCGAGLGLALAGCLNLAVGVPAQPAVDPSPDA